MSATTASASSWLRAQLAHGAIRPRDLRDRAARAGIDPCALDAAKRQAGAVSVQDDRGAWRWTLLAAPAVPPPAPVDPADLAAAFDTLATITTRLLASEAVSMVVQREQPHDLAVALRVGRWHDADSSASHVANAADDLDRDLALARDALATIHAARAGGPRP